MSGAADDDVGPSITLVVLLFVDAERVEEFDRFEERAAGILARYGGAIERRIAFPPSADPSQPREMHVVTFPDRGSFDRYRGDADLRALTELRARAIRRTIVWEGFDRSRLP